MELIRDNVKVEWEASGEGLNGDYDPKDPNDMECLRFNVSVFRDGQWEKKENASYCTFFPASATADEQIEGLEVLMERFYQALHDDIDVSVKDLGLVMSCLSIDAITRELFVPSVPESFDSSYSLVHSKLCPLSDYAPNPEPLKPSLQAQIEDAMSRLPDKSTDPSFTRPAHEYSI